MTVEGRSEEPQIAQASAPHPDEQPADVIDVKVDESMKVEEPQKEESEQDVAETKKTEEPQVVLGEEEKVAEATKEADFFPNLKDNERKALVDLKAKLEAAILEGKLFSDAAAPVEASKVEELKPAPEGNDEKEKPEEKVDEDKKTPDSAEEEKSEKAQIDTGISLWGVPLLPSKGDQRTNVVLLKFLLAREFKADAAFEMLKKTLIWRQEQKMESILDEDLGDSELSSVAYMNGVDREGHPICYNIYGVFEDGELYQRTFGNEEKRRQFLRWRLQVMEKGIQKLDFSPDGISSLLQINDLKNTPGPSKKDLRMATNQAVALLQDNYPEFVARNIFINVPFWYYAMHALLSPFLTLRTKSKIVFARPAKVTETLLKYIAAEDIPIQYGGLKRQNDAEFSAENGSVTELSIKSNSTVTIEIPTPEVGCTLVWDITVVGWEVNYKEEFVPVDEGSYTIIVHKNKKMGSQEVPIRNSFTNNEPGKVVLTVENNSFKKKRVLYRYKLKSSSSS